MDRLTLYQIFVRVVETRSFTQAANTLQMPRSSVSTAIAELEARLGTRLLNRTTRTVATTDEGQRFYDRCQSVLADSEEMEAMFRLGSRRVAGRLRVDLPGRIGRLIVAPALPEFLELWPDLGIELGMTDRAAALIAERIDIAVRIGPLPDSTMRARNLGDIRQINVASPSYLTRHGTPQVPADLDRHWQVAYASPSTGRIMDWSWTSSGQNHTRSVRWRVCANSAEGYIAAALSGMGLIQIPAYDVSDDIAAGRLVEVMPGYRDASLPVHLLFPGATRTRERTRVFSDWLADLLRREMAIGAAPA